MDLFKLEPGLAIWTWITFGILFFILWKFVLPVLLKNLQDREEYISSAVDKTDELDRKLKNLQAERDAILNQANREADEILHRIRQEGELLKNELVLKARKEAEKLLEQARKDAAAEREAALKALEKELAEFICDAAEQVVGMSVVGEKERAWTEETVKSL